MDSELAVYDRSMLPPVFGMNNPGSLCYANSLLQALATCTSLIAGAGTNPACSETGKEFMRFAAVCRALADCNAIMTGSTGADTVVAADKARRARQYLADTAARITDAIRTDLATRRAGHPYVFAAGGQQSSSEFLVVLLDMIEGLPVDDTYIANLVDMPTKNIARVMDTLTVNWATRLFQHRTRRRVRCGACQRITSDTVTSEIIFQLFSSMPSTGWVDALMTDISVIDQYKCERCAAATHNKCARCGASRLASATMADLRMPRQTRCACGAVAPPPSIRVSTLCMVPEILVCAFNIYTTRTDRFVPTTIQIPALPPAAPHTYRLVARVDHFGSLSGGHYVAAVERQDGVYDISDSSVSRSAQTEVQATKDTYLVFFHRT